MSGAHRVSRGRVENNIMVDAYVCPMSRYVKYVHDCPLAFGDVVLSPWVISWMTITFGDMLGDHGSPGRYVIPTPHAQAPCVWVPDNGVIIV
jgi:hypothetical protein